MTELEKKLFEKIKADLEKSSLAINDAIAASIKEALNPTGREMSGLLPMMEKGSFEDKTKGRMTDDELYRFAHAYVNENSHPREPIVETDLLNAFIDGYNKTLEWTAVTDRLPEFNARVLVLSKDGATAISKMITEDGVDIWMDDCCDNVFNLDTVTHWMLLPTKNTAP